MTATYVCGLSEPGTGLLRRDIEAGRAHSERRHRAVSPEELKKLGSTVEALKMIVPTHPHPMAPDHPPFNALLRPGAGLVDRPRDLLTGRAKQ
jgi:hypothetical protein